MSAILAIAKALLGLGGGGSVVNQVLGGVNHAALVAGVGYLLANLDHEISFKTTYGFLALVAIVAYGYLELARRTAPK